MIYRHEIQKPHTPAITLCVGSTEVYSTPKRRKSPGPREMEGATAAKIAKDLSHRNGRRSSTGWPRCIDVDIPLVCCANESQIKTSKLSEHPQHFPIISLFKGKLQFFVHFYFLFSSNCFGCYLWKWLAQIAFVQSTVQHQRLWHLLSGITKVKCQILIFRKLRTASVWHFWLEK